MSVTSARRALLAVLTLFCVLAHGAVAQASPRTNSVEAGIVRAMNDFRAQHGLPGLRQQRGFARAADVHSAKMLRENKLAHGAYGKRVRRYVRRVARVGENLAYQVTVEDPNVLTAPWTAPPRLVKPSSLPLEESPPSKDQDSPLLLNNDHHDQR